MRLCIPAWAEKRTDVADFLIILWLSFPQLPVPATAPEPLAAALVRVACDLDLSTPNEGWRAAAFASDLNWTRYAWRDLWDCPPSWDNQRWPPLAECEHALAANSAYAQWVACQQAMTPRHWLAWETLLGDCYRRQSAWWAAQQAQVDTSIATRRRSLRALRVALGEQDWWEGRLPAPVPGGP